MKKISKEDVEWLIKYGYLKLKKGKYDGLVVCNKQHHAKAKTHYVEDRYFYILEKALRDNNKSDHKPEKRFSHNSNSKSNKRTHSNNYHKSNQNNKNKRG